MLMQIKSAIGRPKTALLIFIFLLAGYFSMSLGMSQFGGYDMSMMISLGDRLASGQSAPKDFFNPMPPFFGLGAKWAIEFFGRSWLGFCVVGGFFYSAAAFAFYMMAKERLGEGRAVMLSFVFFAMTGMFYGFWWHNAVAGCLAALCVLSYCLLDQGWMEKTVFSVASGLLMASKPNIGFIALILLLVVCFPKKMGGHGRLGVALAIVAIAITLLTFACSGQNPWDYVVALGSISEKRVGWSPPSFFELGGATAIFGVNASWFALILSGIVVSTFLISGAKEGCSGISRWRSIFAMLVSLLALMGMVINSDYFHAVLPVAMAMCVMSTVLSFDVGAKLKRAANLLGMSCAVVLLFFMVATSFSRDRVYSIGPGAFWEMPSSSEKNNDGFFKGATIGSQLRLFDSEARAILDEHKGERVYFGPRVEFGYAAYSLPEPKGVPLWFDPQAAWPMDGQDKILDAFVENNFDVLIFNRMDATFFPPKLIEYVRENYRPLSGYAQATPLVKKDKK